MKTPSCPSRRCLRQNRPAPASGDGRIPHTHLGSAGLSAVLSCYPPWSDALLPLVLILYLDLNHVINGTGAAGACPPVLRSLTHDPTACHQRQTIPPKQASARSSHRRAVIPKMG